MKSVALRASSFLCCRIRMPDITRRSSTARGMRRAVPCRVLSHRCDKGIVRTGLVDQQLAPLSGSLVTMDRGTASWHRPRPEHMWQPIGLRISRAAPVDRHWIRADSNCQDSCDLRAAQRRRLEALARARPIALRDHSLSQHFAHLGVSSPAEVPIPHPDVAKWVCPP
jgi:hypothetical protein